MSLPKLLKYLYREKRIRPLGRDFITPYDPTELSWDTLLIMMTTKARDVGAVERLKAKYKAQTARELIPQLPKHKRPSLRSRLFAFFQRLDGSYATDPYKMELKAARRKNRDMRRGMSETQLKYTYKKGHKDG